MYGVPFAETEMYILDEIHFHFGNDLQHGSEHSMDNLFFPVEVYLEFCSLSHDSIYLPKQNNYVFSSVIEITRYFK